MKPAGRHPINGEKMKVQPVRLTAKQIAWLKSQGNMSEAVRALINEAMKK